MKPVRKYRYDFPFPHPFFSPFNSLVKKPQNPTQIPKPTNHPSKPLKTFKALLVHQKAGLTRKFTLISSKCC